MKGSIILIDGVHHVRYRSQYGRRRQVPIFKNKLELSVGDEVEFEIVDEFSHPQLFLDVDLFNGTSSALISSVSHQENEK